MLNAFNTFVGPDSVHLIALIMLIEQAENANWSIAFIYTIGATECQQSARIVRRRNEFQNHCDP